MWQAGELLISCRAVAFPMIAADRTTEPMIRRNTTNV
jgi:hypothetical protein